MPFKRETVVVAQVERIRAVLIRGRWEDPIERRPSRLVSMWMTRLALLVLCLGPLTCRSDEWLTGITPTLVNIGDSGGTSGEYIQLVPHQAVQNPAACPTADSYILRDPLLNKDALAILLTSYTSGTNVQVYLSSSLCDTLTGRPLITQVGLN